MPVRDLAVLVTVHAAARGRCCGKMEGVSRDGAGQMEVPVTWWFLKGHDQESGKSRLFGGRLIKADFVVDFESEQLRCGN